MGQSVDCVERRVGCGELCTLGGVSSSGVMCVGTPDACLYTRKENSYGLEFLPGIYFLFAEAFDWVYNRPVFLGIINKFISTSF